MTTPPSLRQAVETMAEVLRNEKRVLVTCHVKPDGDALGCLIALHRSMQLLGADSAMYIADTAGITPAYRWLRGVDDAHVGTPPADSAARPLFAVDCRSAARPVHDALLNAPPTVRTLPHHRPASRQRRVGRDGSFLPLPGMAR